MDVEMLARFESLQVRAQLGGMRVLRVDSWQIKRPLASRGGRGGTYKPRHWVVLSRSTGRARKERRRHVLWQTPWIRSKLAATPRLHDPGVQTHSQFYTVWLVTTSVGPAGSDAVGPSWKVPPESSPTRETGRFSCTGLDTLLV